MKSNEDLKIDPQVDQNLVELFSGTEEAQQKFVHDMVKIRSAENDPEPTEEQMQAIRDNFFSKISLIEDKSKVQYSIPAYIDLVRNQIAPLLTQFKQIQETGNFREITEEQYKDIVDKQRSINAEYLRTWKDLLERDLSWEFQDMDSEIFRMSGLIQHDLTHVTTLVSSMMSKGEIALWHLRKEGGATEKNITDFNTAIERLEGSLEQFTEIFNAINDLIHQRPVSLQRILNTFEIPYVPKKSKDDKPTEKVKLRNLDQVDTNEFKFQTLEEAFTFRTLLLNSLQAGSTEVNYAFTEGEGGQIEFKIYDNGTENKYATSGFGWGELKEVVEKFYKRGFEYSQLPGFSVTQGAIIAAVLAGQRYAFDGGDINNKENWYIKFSDDNARDKEGNPLKTKWIAVTFNRKELGTSTNNN